MAQPAYYPMGIRGPPHWGGKVSPECGISHSLPPSAEVKNEYELYLLFPQAPPWHIAGHLYFYCIWNFPIHFQNTTVPVCSSFMYNYFEHSLLSLYIAT